MLYTQTQLFANEERSLAPYALKSSQSQGRRHEEQEDPYRTPFQRDRDRIIHSKAFRRLSGKTQVFMASFGDHYRSRLSHSLEVAQVARDIARALGLNEDLCETIALAHDLGHTPFGHAGEDAMNEMMVKYGDKFEHNEQSRRVVEKLERKTSDYPGLNLTNETIEGLMKHRRFHDDQTPVVISLESMVVDIADEIAYHHHDLDDGLRSGILGYEQLESDLEIWSQVIEELDRESLGEELYRHICINRMISILINDVIETSHQSLERSNISSALEEIHPDPLITFSEKIRGRSDQLAEYLGKHFYMDDKVLSLAQKGQVIIKKLFQLYSQRENLLPQGMRERFGSEERHIVIKDYIAGMTDEFALKLFEENKDLL